MATEYQEWLASLGGLRADMPVAVRGQALSHTVTYPGDVTTATLTGSVRAAPDSDTALATFTIGTPAFADGVTTWAISLGEGDWGSIPADTDGNGTTVLPFDFLLNNNRLFGGLFTVSGHITEPA